MLGILVSAFFILLILGVPIAFAIGAATFVPLLFDGRLPFTLVITRMFGGMDSFPLMAIPFFVLTGTLASACNLVDRIMQLASFLVGRMRAGLAQVDVVTSMLFGGVSGSAVADCAATAGILIPSMTNKGYPASYAVGVCATSSTIGALIPPSIPMIIYGFLTGVSTGQLFLAGALPGILVGILLMFTAYIVSIRGGFGRNDDAPRRTLQGLVVAVRESAPALTIPFIIIGGIVGGAFTPTEAGIVASVAVLVIGHFFYGGFTFRKLRQAVMGAALTTSMVMLILAASTVFANLLTRAQFQSQTVAAVERHHDCARVPASSGRGLAADPRLLHRWHRHPDHVRGAALWCRTSPRLRSPAVRNDCRHVLLDRRRDAASGYIDVHQRRGGPNWHFRGLARHLPVLSCALRGSSSCRALSAPDDTSAPALLG